MRTQRSSNYHDSAIQDGRPATQHKQKKMSGRVRNHKSSQEERAATAARVAKHRAKKKSQGIVPVDVPTHVAEAIKRAGSFDIWLQQTMSTYLADIQKTCRLAQTRGQLESLPRWLRWLLFKLFV